MYIQFQSLGIGSFTTDDFDDQKRFLQSYASGSDFRVYESKKTNEVTKDISFKKVIKKLKIESVNPLNKEGKSHYLAFTAIDSKNDSITYEGMICW